jgi:hypothetical protein
MNDQVLTAASSLRRGALVLRGVHLLIAAGGEIASSIYLWAWALTGRRGRALNAALVVLSTEGAGLVAGHGGCPLVPWQIRTSLEHYGPRRDLAAQIVVSQATLGDDRGPVGAGGWSSSTWVSR